MQKITRTIVAAGLGSMLEMYDFVIYILVASILAKLFFPAANHFASLMLTFTAFAAGFLARPFGSLIFGHLGDKFGRKKVLLLTIFLMAISSLLIAAMPSYHHIGLIAPLLIVLFRIMQGIAVGGELAGALTFIAEHANHQYRGFVTAWIFFFINMGVMLASGISSFLSSTMTKVQFDQWGWRLLFVIGAAIALLGIYVRNKIAKSPLFTQAKETQQLASYPLTLMFKTQKSALFKGAGLTVSASVFVGLVVMYLPSYLVTTTHFQLTTALLINTGNVLILSCLIPVFGWLSDLFGRKKIIAIGCLGLLLTAYPLFLLIQHRNNFALLALIVLDLFGAALLGTLGAALTELSITTARYSTVAFSYNIPFALFAGTVPVISLFLIHASNNAAIPAIYLVASAIVTFITLFYITEHKNQKLS